jgi:hypothetical protein
MIMMMSAVAECTLITFGFDKQHRENYVAETARQPYSYKKDDEKTQYQHGSHRLMCVHHNMRSRCPCAYQYMKRVRHL